MKNMDEQPKITKKIPDSYTPEQSEFLRAVMDFRTRTGRHVLRVTDYLHVIHELGYRRRKKKK